MTPSTGPELDLTTATDTTGALFDEGQHAVVRALDDLSGVADLDPLAVLPVLIVLAFAAWRRRRGKGGG